MKPLYLIIHYFFIFVKLKAGFSRFARYEQDLEQDLQDMSRIYMIYKIFRIFSRSGDRELQRPVSRRRGDCGGQAPALRGRSSLSVGGDRLILTCSRLGDRELQGPPCIAPLCSAGAPDPARTATKNPAKSGIS